MDTLTRKYNIIDKIVHLEDSRYLYEIEKVLSRISPEAQLDKTILTMPLNKTLEFDKLKKEHKGFNKANFQQTIVALNIQEPVEMLLGQLNK